MNQDEQTLQPSGSALLTLSPYHLQRKTCSPEARQVEQEMEWGGGVPSKAD